VRAQPPSDDIVQGMSGSRIGLTALAAFFGFGAMASGTAALSLAIPGTVLDRAWALNPRGHQGLLGLGGWGVGLMVLVCAACLTTTRGLWVRAAWGRFLALAILATNITGDTVTAIITGDGRTLIGIPIGVAMIAFLFSRDVKAAFGALKTT